MSRETEKILSISRIINMEQYFKKFGHTCNLKVRDEDEIPVADNKNWFREKLFEWSTIDLTSNLTLQHFNSYSTAANAKKRHREEHPLTIHPFSRLKMAWECVMLFSFLIGLVYIPLQYLDYVDDDASNNVGSLLIMKVTKALGVVDMVVIFFSGDWDQKNFEVSFKVKLLKVQRSKRRRKLFL